MSSSKGSSNSNKTAHVMNLLRKNTPQPPADSAAATQAPPPAAPVPQTPPILTALHADAEVSSQIRDALQEALAEEESIPTAQQSPLPTQPPVVHPADAPAAPPVSEVEAEPPSVPTVDIPAPVAGDSLAVPTPATPPIPESVTAHDPAIDPMVEPIQSSAPPQAEALEPSTSDTSATESTACSDDSVLINVMARLAEDKADKYIKLFGLCTCERCKRDVIALALNTLPAKYVVMPEWEFSIRFDMYANRYSSELTAELLRACKEVMDNPRH